MKKNLMFVILLLIIVLSCTYLFKPNNNKHKNKKEDEVVYKDEFTIEYKVDQDTKRINNHNVTFKRNIVKVTNKAKPEVAKKIQDFLKETSDEEWDQFVSYDDKVTKDITEELKYKDINITKNYLSFIKECKKDDEIYNINTYMFETKVGVVIKLKSISDNDEELFEYVGKECSKKVKEYKNLNEDWESYLDTDYYNNFSLDDKYLIIYINKENVSEDKGIIEVKIEKEKIKELLKEEYR